MRIMQILPELNSGGVERGTLETGQALVQAGHESLVVSNGGRLVRQLEVEGSVHFRLPVHRKSPLGLLQVPALRALILRTRPDIIHVRSRVPAWLTFLALRLLPASARPLWISTVHGFYSVNRYSAIMAATQHVITVSDSVTRYVQTAWPQVPASRITRIFRGIDPAEFPHGYQPPAVWWQNTYQRFPMLEHKKLVCLPGRITRLKGHESLISLMQHLIRERDDVMAVVVGGADTRKQTYLTELEQKISAAGLSNHILFAGHQSDIRNWLAASDVVLSLSSKPETFGRTTLEALALGRPTAGWAHGGVEEILSALYPAGRIEPFNEEALARTVSQMLQQPVTPAPVQMFQKSQMTGETLALYQRLLDHPPASD